MPIHVLYFAGAREAAGAARETLERAPATVAELRRTITEAHPALARILPRCRIAVDQEFAGEDAPLRDGAEVAIVPPVAGGALSRAALPGRGPPALARRGGGRGPGPGRGGS
jgi:molybdopterin synthase catalytic subunit